MRLYPGVEVTITAGFRLVVGIGSTRFRGRFLFLPAQLRAGDQVWLRLDRPGASSSNARWQTVDVSGHVTHVLDAAGGPLRMLRPAPGGRFTLSIARTDPAVRGHGTTRGRWQANDDFDDEDIYEATESTPLHVATATIPDQRVPSSVSFSA